MDLNECEEKGTMLLLQREEAEAGASLVQTVRGNYEGYTRREILKAKEAR